MNKTQLTFPEEFTKRISLNYPFAESLMDSLNSAPPISIRLHPEKEMEDFSFKSKIHWAKNGVYLTERPTFTLDPNFHGGAYYPQEAGSMYLGTILENIVLKEDPIVLDACAAPGGKTSILAEKLNNEGVLISNEIIKSRASVLMETTTKWGYCNQIITSNDTKSFRKSRIKFDLIVIDAPCSGEGMFRKDHKARGEWSIANCNICVTRQKEILENLLPSLNEAGYLVYSTCTFNPAENEELLIDFINKFDLEVCKMPQYDGMLQDKEGIGQYFFPGFTESEGFYCAVLKKKGHSEMDKLKISTNSTIAAPNFIKKSKTEIKYYQNENFIYACHPLTQHVSTLLKENLFVLKTGTLISQQFGKKQVPQIELALSPFIETNFEQLTLTKDLALKYLKGETFELASTPGFKEILYGKITLGFINHLGNRFNNLYPNEWRIKMKIT